MKSKKIKRQQHSMHVDSEIIAHLAAANSIFNSKLKSHDNDKKAIRHVKKARKIAMRKTIRLPRSIRAQFCNSCKIPFAIGKNCTIRTRNKFVIYHCLNCKNMQKFGNSKKMQSQ